VNHGAEDFLRARFDALRDSADDGDWLDVRRRARTRRVRRGVTVALAAALAVAVATPALGLHRVVVDWLEAAPAPERTQRNFDQLSVIHGDEGPGIVPGSARKVAEFRHDGKLHVLSVTPTEDGGFCYQWTDLFGSCRAAQSAPAGQPRHPDDVAAYRIGATHLVGERDAVEIVGGNVLGAEVERLVAVYADGAREEIPLIWVSPPIDAGFYLHWVPKERRRPGRHLTALVAEDASGGVVARQTFKLVSPEDVERPVRLPDGQLASLPATAVVERARKLIEFRASNDRRITVWLVPTRDGRRCYIHPRGGGCLRELTDLAMTGGLHPGSQPVLFGGQVRADVAAVELRYQNGTSERVRPVEGFVLHEIAPAHYAPGKRLEEALAVDAEGRVLERQRVRPEARGVYPCEKPVDVGNGVELCP
jgi:hypothetical protein